MTSTLDTAAINHSQAPDTMNTTAEIDGILCNLNRLHDAYTEVLEQAKSQLETLEVDDSVVQRLADRIIRNDNLIDNLARMVINSLTDQIGQQISDERYAARHLVSALRARISSEINTEVIAAINDHLSGTMIQERVDGVVRDRLSSDRGPLAAELRTRLARVLGQGFGTSFTDDAMPRHSEIDQGS